jgi:hypothetical protein
MRGRLAIALSVSLVLIGFASWSRLTAGDKAQPNLIAVAQLNADPQEILNDFLAPKTASTTAIAGQLTNTDIVSRQLFLDYMSLASDGEVSEATLATLAENYAQNIPLLQGEKASYLDLKTVTNTEANFRKYSNALALIYTQHAQNVGRAYAGETGESLDKSYYSSSKNAAAAYLRTALALKDLPVPTALASIHLELVNRHFSSATGLEAVAQADEDPLTAMSGLITISENVEHEVLALHEIEKVLNANGL